MTEATVGPTAVTAPAAAPEGDRLPLLDGMRGLAILLVLTTHLAGPEVSPALAHGSMLERTYAKIVASGDSGVDLFFVLSGYLITRVLLRAKGSPLALRTFYMRRVLRIFPLYYASLVAAFLVLPTFLSTTAEVAKVQREQAWLWLYAGNLATGLRGVWFSGGWLLLTHFWSLAVEEQFYLVWPFVVFGLAPKKLLRTCLALVALALFLKLAFLRGPHKHAAYVLTPCRFDGLSLGAMIAVAGSLTPLSRFARAAGWTLAASGGLLGLLLFQAGSNAKAWWTPAFVHTLYAVAYASLLVRALTASATSFVGRFWGSPVLGFFGRYSYGLYVTHYMLRPLYTRLVPPERIAPWTGGSRILAVVAFGVFAATLSVVVAWLSWHGIEKRFLKLKSAFEYRSSDLRPRTAGAHVPSDAPSTRRAI